MVDWLAQIEDSERLLVLDIGSGYSTPTVIRWTMERIAQMGPNRRLLRINNRHPEVPVELAGRATSLAVDIGELLTNS